jgi:hypothetical protein
MTAAAAAQRGAQGMVAERQHDHQLGYEDKRSQKDLNDPSSEERTQRLFQLPLRGRGVGVG